MLERFVNRHPVLLASALYAGVVALAFWPIWGGAFLINDLSDARTGFAFRLFAANYFRAHHGVPQWDPYIFSGLPFAAGHGDALYPTFLLRLLFPVDVGISLGFMIHIVLAGVFAFLFLRELKLEWGPAFVGGAAYLFSGQVVSMVSPGHDGKLYVSALLPLSLMLLYQGVTRGDWRRYLGFGAVVGFSLLTPHYQMTYYLLMAAGFLWIYLVFLSGERPAGHRPALSFALFSLAIGVGVALAAAQVAPFYEYLAHSPRTAAGSSSSGWEYATSWAMPPEELTNTVWPAFSGILEAYWGRNPFKLHSEYVGVTVLMLASCSFRLATRRRLAWFWIFLGGFGIIFSFGGYTPFYYLPYYLLPGIKLTRAPAMIFYLSSFSAAVLAAMGVQALGQAEASDSSVRIWRWWLGVLGVVGLLALAGVWEPFMQALAPAERAEQVMRNYPAFRLDTIRVLIAGGLLAGLCWWRGRIPAAWWNLAVGGLVLLELWSVERRYIRWSPPASVSFAADQVVRALPADSEPYRVLPIGLYRDTYLMTQGVRSVLGYHGNELHRYDELLGGKNLWRNAGNPNLWHLLAVRYIVVPERVNFGGLVSVGDSLQTADQVTGFLYRVDGARPFAYLVREALRTPDPQVVPTLMDPRFDPSRLLLVPPDAPAGVSRIEAIPDTIGIRVTTEAPRAGAYRFRLSAPPAQPAYLFVAENYYADWHARVDGRPAPVLRAQYALMAIPIPAGAREISLEFESAWYRGGLILSVLTALALLALAGWSRARRGKEPARD
jgi:hypothetical protein